jgi:hypothetical protein
VEIKRVRVIDRVGRTLLSDKHRNRDYETENPRSMA